LDPETPPETEQMSEEEFDLEPETPVEEKASLTRTILSEISAEDVQLEEAEDASPSTETPDFSEITRTSRGPPGGGRLIREGAPKKPATGPPTRGPPVSEAEDVKHEVLTPVQRPVLQPVARRVLTPVVPSTDEESNGEKLTVLTPVTRAVLKPITTSTSEEEE